MLLAWFPKGIELVVLHCLPPFSPLFTSNPEICCQISTKFHFGWKSIFEPSTTIPFLGLNICQILLCIFFPSAPHPNIAETSGFPGKVPSWKIALGSEETKNAAKAAPSKAKHDAIILICQNHGLLGFFEAHLVCINHSLLAKYFTVAVTSGLCAASFAPSALCSSCLCLANLAVLWATGGSLPRLFWWDSSYPAKSDLPSGSTCFPRET